uniref:Major facilitator superfamily (MFS) profile domain-containing protein n=1 Tax=Bionectria ochroleuca TaxID=29856 RepID=A0A8H7TVI2_BIOOC
MFDLSFKKRSQDGDSNDLEAPVVPERAPKPFWEAIMPVFACGAGLFSDGYINNVIGSVNTVLALQYGALYKNNSASQNVSSIAFAGTVVGQLAFGYLSDAWSRTTTPLFSPPLS